MRLSPRHALPAATLVALLALAACSSDSPEAVSEGADVDLEHVHGLAVDPADPERVLIATHHGLAAFSEGAGLEAVGDLRSDFMGFTVGPDDVFYASGHPGEGESGPGAVGLITSADGGLTWEPLSLEGEADFHALEAHRDGIFGYDAATGLLRVSEDGRAWEQVPTEDGFLDLAADPTSSRLVGTTGRGELVEGRVGEIEFAPVPDAPDLVLVDFTPDGGLVGVGVDGTVHSWSEATGWQEREGRSDEGLRALAAGPDGVVWLFDGRGLLRSDDGGDSFVEVA